MLYLRGTPSALTRYFGNLHLTVRPLRMALYARMRRTGQLAGKSTIREVIPCWDDAGGCVVWDETVTHLASLDGPEADGAVPPAAAVMGDGMLDRPEDAVEALFPRQEWPQRPEGVSGKDYNNHLFAVRSRRQRAMPCHAAQHAVMTLGRRGHG